MRPLVHRVSAIAPALVLLATACSDGAPGDLDKVPKQSPDILGDGNRLSELNDLGAQHPPDGTVVHVTGVSVLAVDDFDETSDGSSAGNLYVQDLPVNGTPPPYGGITLFDPSFSPPTLRVGPGDVVDVRGQYDEFEGPNSSPFTAGQTLPEIVGGAVSLRFESPPPEPFTIQLSDLASYDTGRRWIGMLVRVENVTAQEAGYKSSSGRYSVRLAVSGVTDGKQLPTITNALFDLENSGVPVAQNTSYTSIVGIVQYFYNFSISPRSAADIQY
jgi:hypothetical protein